MGHGPQNWGSVSDDVPYSSVSDIGVPRVGYLAEWNQSAEHK